MVDITPHRLLFIEGDSATFTFEIDGAFVDISINAADMTVTALVKLGGAAEGDVMIERTPIEDIDRGLWQIARGMASEIDRMPLSTGSLAECDDGLAGGLEVGE